MDQNLPEFLSAGEPARLFPVLAESSKEGRVLSVFLSCLAKVDDFGGVLFSAMGQKLGSRSRVSAYTEISFGNDEGIAGRPDGLLSVKSGAGKFWHAVVEAKVKREKLDGDQLGRYLRLAKINGVHAAVTISNDFAAVPTHHPLDIKPPKGVALYHLSWASILTHAKILLMSDDDEVVADGEQRFILGEFVRFLEHPSTGVMRFDKMGGGWKDFVGCAVAGAKPGRESVENAVANWHQATRDLSLKFTESIHANVAVKLPAPHRNDPGRRLADEMDHLDETSMLKVDFAVPDAAAPVHVEADMRTRSIRVSMALDAPADRKSTRARTNWILRQLSKTSGDGFHVRALWRGRTRPTQESLDALRENPDALESDAPLPPHAYEVVLVHDMGARFGGPKTFVKELEQSVLLFYREAGQKLKKWVPPAPKADDVPPKEDEGIETCTPT